MAPKRDTRTCFFARTDVASATAHGLNSLQPDVTKRGRRLANSEGAATNRDGPSTLTVRVLKRRE